LLAQEAQGLIHQKDISFMESWASLWHLWVCGIFLKPYLEIASQGEFLPKGEEETRLLLNAYLLEKAIYELGYELNNRPDWVKIPIRGIKQLLGTERD